MRKLSESTARQTIGMMRSIASHKPISPFHLMAADEMERLLNEVLEYRKANNERTKFKHMGKGARVAQEADDHQAT
jgi:CelD/BcsL family acetyltransferase involved in cellulose biosynthesis